MSEFYKRQTDENNIIEILEKQLVDSKQNDVKPKAILLGGLPGAGKTALCKKVLEENKNSNYVVIDVDEYRKYSPIFSENSVIPTSKIIELSCDFANNVASQILEYSLRNKKNIIINTPLRETNLMIDFINNKFIPNGYNVDISIIVTPIEECIISSQERYEKQIEEKEFPRFTTIEFIEEAEKKIYQTIEKLEKMINVNKIEIYIRGENEKKSPIKVYSSIDKEKKYQNLIEIIEKCKENEKNRKTNKEQLERINKLYEKRKKRGAEQNELEILDKMKDYYKKLNKK